MNPNIRINVYKKLNKIKNIYLVKPLDYFSFIYLMEVSYLISENGLKKRKLFNKSFLNKIVDDEYNNIDDNSQKIWQLLTLEQWFRNTEK